MPTYRTQGKRSLNFLSAREDLMTEAAGQGVGFVTSMKPARQILFDLVEEALAAFEERVGELA